jgi:hypothetical protein
MLVYAELSNVSALFIYMNEEGFAAGVVPRKSKVMYPECRKVLESL